MASPPPRGEGSLNGGDVICGQPPRVPFNTPDGKNVDYIFIESCHLAMTEPVTVRI